MQKIAKLLTDYVISKGMVDKAERQLYEYGFTLSIELGLFILFSLIVSISFHMLIEGVLFFIIFAPLRSYAGGLHLEKFCACFILSCLTFSVVLFIATKISIPAIVSLPLIIFLQVMVYSLHPIENSNREVDKEESAFFKARLLRFLGIDLGIAIACVILHKREYLTIIVATFLGVVVTMLLGKYKYKKHNQM